MELRAPGLVAEPKREFLLQLKPFHLSDFCSFALRTVHGLGWVGMLIENTDKMSFEFSVRFVFVFISISYV